MTLNIEYCQSAQFDENIKILPSDRIYYNDFPYRIKLKGPGFPHPDYDPYLHYDITEFMKSCNMLWKRDITKTSGRSIYLPTYDDVLWFCSWKGEYVDSVTGPVSDKHLSALFVPDLLIREKLFYNKFNYRVELWFGSVYPSMLAPVSDARNNAVSAMIDFVGVNLNQYRWGHTDFNWYYNYLYCEQSEYEEIEGFFNLSFKQYIRCCHKVKLFSEL